MPANIFHSDSMTDTTPANSSSSTSAAYRPSPHWIAVFAALFTLPLLLVGGSVTTYRVGMAVPDWPTTFGINMFLYDFWNAPFGVRVEHTHRLYGAAVGLATIALTAWFLIFERRKWMKVLGVVALIAVIVQGVLGGTRVTQVSTTLAAVHGCMGQAFFGLMVAICVFTGRDWLSGRSRTVDAWRFRRRTLVMLGLIYFQIILGAWLRHFGTIPAVALHTFMAAAVWIHALVLAVRVELAGPPARTLVPSARALGITATLQVLLGVVAFLYLLPFDGTPRPVGFYQAVVRTAHQTNGAILLAASVVLALRAFRQFERTGEPRAVVPPRSTAPDAEPVSVNLEVVA